MYHHLRGKLVALGSLNAVVETAGVGWDVQIPLSTRALLGDSLGDEVFLHTHLLVREDILKLFGFSTVEERELFRLLLSVSGTGPKIALQALSAFSVAELVRDLSSGDVDSLKRIKGVGKKTGRAAGARASGKGRGSPAEPGDVRKRSWAGCRRDKRTDP